MLMEYGERERDDQSKSQAPQDALEYPLLCENIQNTLLCENIQNTLLCENIQNTLLCVNIQNILSCVRVYPKEEASLQMRGRRALLSLPISSYFFITHQKTSERREGKETP